jgi:hypothetical protein
VFNAESFADRRWLGDDGHGIVTASDRELLKAWVDVLGPPIFRRPIKYGKRRLSVSWPLIDTIRPAPARLLHGERPCIGALSHVT